MLGVLQLSHGSNLYSKNSYLCDSFVSVSVLVVFHYIHTACVVLGRLWARGSECLLVVVVLSLSFAVRDH